jgi:hypothetical protein
METSTKKTRSKKGANFHRSQKPRPAAPTTKAGTVTDARPEQCSESSQTDHAILHSEPDAKRRGRKPKYRKEFAAIAKAMCKLGATDYDLAQEFEVATSTIWRWCSKYPEFCSAIKVEKASFDDRVERSLAQRALGYSYHAEKPFQYRGEVMKVQYVEHVPPDVAAAKFWLLNRRRAQWSDTSRHELTGANGGEIKIRERSDLDRARRIAYILSQAAATKVEP